MSGRDWQVNVPWGRGSSSTPWRRSYSRCLVWSSETRPCHHTPHPPLLPSQTVALRSEGWCWGGGSVVSSRMFLSACCRCSPEGSSARGQCSKQPEQRPRCQILTCYSHDWSISVIPIKLFLIYYWTLQKYGLNGNCISCCKHQICLNRKESRFYITFETAVWFILVCCETKWYSTSARHCRNVTDQFVILSNEHLCGKLEDLMTVWTSLMHKPWTVGSSPTFRSSAYSRSSLKRSCSCCHI